MKKILILLISIHSFLFGNYSLREINSLAEIISHVEDNNTLVIFDIDNTLLHPATDLGSDQWFYHKVQELMLDGIDHQKALQEMLPIYFHINHHIHLVPTEADALEIVKQIQQKTDFVMCLTARSLPLIRVTQEQLRKNNFSFKLFDLKHHEFHLTYPCCYSDGVLFCASNDKGIALFALLDHVGFTPGKIIIIDDKEKNLHALINAAQKRKIPCIGLRYAGCDHRVVNFDKHRTQVEFEDFINKHPLATNLGENK